MDKKMNTDSDNCNFPNRILYTMVRVADLDRSIAFYRDLLGMRELRRETFPDGRFTLVFMGYGDEASGATIELTWNWNWDEATIPTVVALAISHSAFKILRLQWLVSRRLVARLFGPLDL